MPAAIYLDHNATTPILPEVVEAMRACWEKPYLNPASQHEFGRAARRVLEDARERIAELLGAGPRDRVIFTSGGTEANNLAIRGLLARVGAGYYCEVPPPGIPVSMVISAAEHPSISALAEELKRFGHGVSILPLNTYGTIQTKWLQSTPGPTTLIAATLANNETGVIQPIAELSSFWHENGIPVHTDASQAAGKLPVNFRELGVATMAIVAHKFGGPVGIGALVVQGTVELQPQLFGGFQQAGTRPGTESIALAVGMQRALECWNDNRSAWAVRLRDLRDRFENAIRAGYPSAFIVASKAQRLPHVSNIAFVGLDRQALFLALDQAGVACSTGSACASGSSEPSPVHLAMGLDEVVISSALRFSLGVTTTRDEIDDAARRIINVCNTLGRRKER